MIQSSFSKLTADDGSITYVNLDNVRHISANPTSNTVVIYYIGQTEKLLLTGSNATQFIADLESATAS